MPIEQGYGVNVTRRHTAGGGNIQPPDQDNFVILNGHWNPSGQWNNQATWDN